MALRYPFHTRVWGGKKVQMFARTSSRDDTSSTDEHNLIPAKVPGQKLGSGKLRTFTGMTAKQISQRNISRRRRAQDESEVKEKAHNKKEDAWAVTKKSSYQGFDLTGDENTGRLCLTCNEKKEKVQLTKRKCRHVEVNRVCVTAAQKLEKGGARPDGFEQKENPRLRPSARVIDASPCPRITTQHNATRMSGRILKSVWRCLCAPVGAWPAVSGTWFWICLKAVTPVPVLSALARRLFEISAPLPAVPPLPQCTVPADVSITQAI